MLFIAQTDYRKSNMTMNRTNKNEHSHTIKEKMRTFFPRRNLKCKFPKQHQNSDEQTMPTNYCYVYVFASVLVYELPITIIANALGYFHIHLQ